MLSITAYASRTGVIIISVIDHLFPTLLKYLVLFMVINQFLTKTKILMLCMKRFLRDLKSESQNKLY